MEIKIVSQEDSIICEIAPIKNISGSIVSLEFIDDYNKEYEITPKMSKQIIETYDKRAIKDITINAIPYKEIENEYGGKTCMIAVDV